MVLDVLSFLLEKVSQSDLNVMAHFSRFRHQTTNNGTAIKLSRAIASVAFNATNIFFSHAKVMLARIKVRKAVVKEKLFLHATT